jgi:hypothetical protein
MAFIVFLDLSRSRVAIVAPAITGPHQTYPNCCCQVLEECALEARNRLRRHVVSDEICWPNMTSGMTQSLLIQA